MVKISIELHRHNISDKGWEKINPDTIGEKGTREGKDKNTRQSIKKPSHRIWSLEKCSSQILSTEG